MKCIKCGHEWVPRVEVPARCPACKSSTYMFPPGVGVSTGRAVPRISAGDTGIYSPETGIFDAEHPEMADEVANVRDALSEGAGSARLGTGATSSAPPADPSPVNTQKRDSGQIPVRKTVVLTEPKDWSDPTPLETVEVMTVAEAQRRYPEYAGKAQVAERLAQGKTAYPIEEGETLFILDESREPDMDELRKIASGEINPTGYEAQQERQPVGGQNSDEVLSTPCPFKELDPETNEWVYCALKAHPPKTRHVPGRRESA
jgi:hypothetical protein